MRTLEQAMMDRIAQAKEESRLRSEEAARREAELDELERTAARLFNEMICDEYDLEPGAIVFKATWNNGGTYTFQATVGEGYVQLQNPVRWDDEGICIMPIGRLPDKEWKTSHGGYYYSCKGLIDAAIHAIYGVGASTIAEKEAQ